MSERAIGSGKWKKLRITILDRETAKALVALTEEGDRAITKLNACIDLYNHAIESQKGIK